tara:strand:- start:875 stop:1312 length:438 start_codon:yes stop_codon:yes gene_type:complete
MKYRSKCALAGFLDRIGDKWSLLIIRDMIFFRKKTFNDFLTSSEGIASNILTNRLKSLVKDGYINFKINPSNKKVKWYYLTDMGISTIPIIKEMMKWSIKNDQFDYSEMSLKIVKKFNDDSNEVVQNEISSSYAETRNEILANSI